MNDESTAMREGYAAPTYRGLDSGRHRPSTDESALLDVASASVTNRTRGPNDVGRDRGDLQPGDIVAGRHVVQQWLAEVPLAQLYLAQHTSISTLSYVLKILKKEHVAVPELVDQFRNEAQTIAQLRDAHTVRVTDMGMLPDGRPFICREFCVGAVLDDLVAQRGPQPTALVRHIALGVLSSLREAHNLGIVHRDIQPRAICVTEDPGSHQARARVLDFGSAHVVASLPTPSLEPETNPSLILCTPQYAAPELLRGEVTPAADVYAFGLTMAELLEGRPVFGDGPFISVAAQQLSYAPVALGERALASPLAPILQKATAKNPDQRYANAGQMLDDILALTDGPSDDDALHWHHYRMDLPTHIATPELALASAELHAILAESAQLNAHANDLWTMMDEAPTAPRMPALDEDAWPVLSPFTEAQRSDDIAQHLQLQADTPAQDDAFAAPLELDWLDEASSDFRIEQTSDFAAVIAAHHDPRPAPSDTPSNWTPRSTATVALSEDAHGDLPSTPTSPSGTAIMRKSQIIAQQAAEASRTRAAITPSTRPDVAKSRASVAVSADAVRHALASVDTNSAPASPVAPPRPMALIARILLLVAIFSACLWVLFGGLP